MLEWLIAALVTVNVIFLVVIYLLSQKKEEIDPLMLSMLDEDMPPETLMMMQMSGSKMNPMTMFLMSKMMKNKKETISQSEITPDLKREVMESIKPMIKEKLKKETEKEIKKYFELK